MNKKTRQAFVSFLEEMHDQNCIHHEWEDTEFWEYGEHGEPSILQTCIHCGETRERPARVLMEIVEKILKQTKITLKK